MGPAQPYLAYRVGTDVGTINSITTMAGFTGLIGSVLAACTFKDYVTDPFMKILVFSAGNLLSAVALYLLPSFCTMWGLIACFGAKNVVHSYSGNAVSGMFVYTLGPEKSRMLVMGHHLVVGVGFLLGPFIVGRHLPRESPRGREEVCQSGLQNQNRTAPETDEPDVDVAAYVDEAFRELAYMSAAVGVFYLALLLLPGEIPVYEGYAEELHSRSSSTASLKSKASSSAFQPAPRESLTLLIVALFYWSACGGERVFQSMQFTFALCGPLQLAPREAVMADKLYNGGFMLGRLLSVPATLLMPPR